MIRMMTTTDNNHDNDGKKSQPLTTTTTMGLIVGQIDTPLFNNSIDAVYGQQERQQCDQLTLVDLTMCDRTISTILDLLLHHKRWKRIILWGLNLVHVDVFLHALVDVAGNNKVGKHHHHHHPSSSSFRHQQEEALTIEEVSIRSIHNLDVGTAIAIGKLLASSQILQLTKFSLSTVTLSGPSINAMTQQVLVATTTFIPPTQNNNNNNNISDDRGNNNNNNNNSYHHETGGVPKRPPITITSVRFSCCTFDDNNTTTTTDKTTVVSGLAQLLQCLDGLVSVRIDSCRVSDQDMVVLLNAMMGHRQLQEIAIPYNKCHANTMRTLAELLQTPDCSIQTLDCSRQYPVGGVGDGLDGDDDDDDDDSENDNIDDDDVGDNDNDSSSFPLDSLLPGLEQNTSLVSLDLSHCRIRTSMWIRLIELYLGGNTNMNDSYSQTMKGPTSNSASRLQSLILCGVPIPPTAMSFLISTLPECNPSLRRLWLSGGIIAATTRTTSSSSSATMSLSTSLTGRRYYDPVLSHPWSLLGQVFVDAIKDNWTLHDILLPSSFSPVLRKYVQYYTDLNRSGRCLLRFQNCTTDDDTTTRPAVPSALWPFVLERAAKRIVNNNNNNNNNNSSSTDKNNNIGTSVSTTTKDIARTMLCPTSIERIVNVSFHLLRNGILLETSR